MHSGLRISAIVNCAGRGTRFGSNKLLVVLEGMTVMERTVRSMLVPIVDEVVVTVSADNVDDYRRILVEEAGLPVRLVVGGAERHLSAAAGLAATSGDIVVVHDGVRPFATEEMVTAVVDAAIASGSAMVGLPSTVQVKLVDDSGVVERSLDRSHSWMGQTPQAFRRALLETAYAAAADSGYARVSDDADLVHEFAGTAAQMILGRPENIKLTTPQDLATARLIARREVADDDPVSGPA